jgi:hypothetical protein
MTDLETSVLRAQAEDGDADATDQLIESAAEHGDLATLERLANAGQHDGRGPTDRVGG